MCNKFDDKGYIVDSYSALASALQKATQSHTSKSTYAESVPPKGDIAPKHMPIKPVFSANTTSNQSEDLSKKSNFGISWIAFCLVCFFPFLIAEIVLDAIFFDPGATAGVHVFLALVACIACGFGYSHYDSTKKAKDNEAIQKARYLYIGIAVICVIASLIIMSISSANEKNRNESLYSTNSSYSSSLKDSPCPPVNRELPMSKETAEQLSGTGYHGCVPYSAAENLYLRSAQATCSNCGYHTTHGENSLCDYCTWLFLHDKLD